MNPDPRSAANELPVRLAIFATLAALVAWHWARLVTDPPLGRVALAAVALAAGAALLALISSAELGRAPARVLAALAALGATVLGLVAIGVPAGLLEPGDWGRLVDELGLGFAGLDGDVEYPYRGQNEWTRLVLLAGLPVALGLAAVLSFWPSGKATPKTRMLGLATLVGTYAVAAAAVAPEEPLIWGLLLLFGVAGWVWLPRLERRDAITAGALIAVAGAFAVAAAGRLDAADPWVDYNDWELSGSRGGVGFDWDHNYGPLDWPRDGTRMLAVKSNEPHYWRASVLDRFDGTRWVRPEGSVGRRLEVPIQVEGDRHGIALYSLRPEWVEKVDVTFGEMRSDLLVGPGTVIEVDGLDGVLSLPDGTTVSDDEPIDEGDAYSMVAYAPDPTADEMRAAPRRYSPVLARYTEVGLPEPPEYGEAGTVAPLLDDVEVPLRGSDRAGEGAARRLLDSPYAEMYRLALRLTADQPTAYGAVEAIEDHLEHGPYSYSEVPPDHTYPLAAFLSEDLIGYCQQFSGTMALMLRMVGIPSRVATGFSPGAADEGSENRYLVTDFDAHSWVEVYFTGIGWVPFDPTPAAAPAASQLWKAEFGRGTSGLESDAEGKAEQPKPATDPGPGGAPRDGGGPWMILPAGIGLLGLALAAPAAIRARRFRSLSSAAAAEAQLRELGAGLARLASPVRPGETLLALEHRLRMRRRPATAGYVAKLRAGRFESGPPIAPTLAERRRVRRELGSKQGLAGRLRSLLAIPPGAPRR